MSFAECINRNVTVSLFAFMKANYCYYLGLNTVSCGGLITLISTYNAIENNRGAVRLKMKLQ